MKFRVELVWQDGEESAASSMYLTSDGRVILQGRAVSPQERRSCRLPPDADMISVDRNAHPRHQGDALGRCDGKDANVIGNVG